MQEGKTAYMLNIAMEEYAAFKFTPAMRKGIDAQPEEQKYELARAYVILGTTGDIEKVPEKYRATVLSAEKVLKAGKKRYIEKTLLRVFRDAEKYIAKMYKEGTPEYNQAMRELVVQKNLTIAAKLPLKKRSE